METYISRCPFCLLWRNLASVRPTDSVLDAHNTATARVEDLDRYSTVPALCQCRCITVPIAIFRPAEKILPVEPVHPAKAHGPSIQNVRRDFSLQKL